MTNDKEQKERAGELTPEQLFSFIGIESRNKTMSDNTDRDAAIERIQNEYAANCKSYDVPEQTKQIVGIIAVSVLRWITRTRDFYRSK